MQFSFLVRPTERDLIPADIGGSLFKAFADTDILHDLAARVLQAVFQDVLQAELEWIHIKRLGELIHLRFVCAGDLGNAESPVS